MRKAEEKLYYGLVNKESFKCHKGDGKGCYQDHSYLNKYRDELTVTEDGYEVALWGHIISERKGNRLELNECGHATQTTASRLNVVCQYEHLPVSYCYGRGGYFIDNDGNEYRSGRIVWDFSENRIVEE